MLIIGVWSPEICSCGCWIKRMKEKEGKPMEVEKISGLETG